MWLFFAFVPAIFDAGGNIIDGYLSNRFFKQPIILLFYIAIIELCLLPCFLLFQHPQVLHGPTLALFAIIGGLEIAYIAIYLLALLTDDTSVVVSMFSLGKVVVPLFAFFLVGEELTAQKYIAFFVIIVSTTLLTLHMESGRVRFNKSLWLMLSSSVLHGVEGVLYKVALEQVTWATGFAYTTLFSTVGLVILTLFQWRQIALHFSSFRSNLFIICSNAFLAFFSNMSGAIALSLAPVTLVKGIWATQPIFVLAFSSLLRTRHPSAVRESGNRTRAIVKISMFVIIAVAVYFSVA